MTKAVVYLLVFIMPLTAGSCKFNDFSKESSYSSRGNSNFSEIFIFNETRADGAVLFPSAKLNDGFILYSGDNIIEKYNWRGECILKKDLFPTLNNDSIISIVASENGGFVLLFHRSTEPRIIKFDKDANVIWTKVYEDVSYPGVNKIFSVDSEVITLGYMENEEKIYLTKLDDNGKIVVESFYNANDSLFYAEYIPDVGIAVLIHASLIDPSSINSVVSSGIIAVFDFSLELKWQKSLEEPLQFYVSKNHIYIGNTKPSGMLWPPYILYKIDFDGGSIFTKGVGNGYFEIGGIIQDSLILYKQGILSILSEEGTVVSQITFSKQGYYTILNEIIEADEYFYILSTRYEEPIIDTYSLVNNSAEPLKIKERVYACFDFNWNVIWEEVVEVE
ncbi:MAG: hypothetical protein FWF04_03005 [Clostridiales bacterium]|nr:hypothetical protein [Clostridiales bacterium]